MNRPHSEGSTAPEAHKASPGPLAWTPGLLALLAAWVLIDLFAPLMSVTGGGHEEKLTLLTPDEPGGILLLGAFPAVTCTAAIAAQLLKAPWLRLLAGGLGAATGIVTAAAASSVVADANRTASTLGNGAQAEPRFALVLLLLGAGLSLLTGIAIMFAQFSRRRPGLEGGRNRDDEELNLARNR